jgi:hypothetical protein
MRHTDPRLTASVYTDEKLRPLAAEIQSVPGIPMREESGNALPLPQMGSLVRGTPRVLATTARTFPP